FQEQNSSTDLPNLLYNIPQRTGSDMPNDLLAELAQLSNIVGVKQANAASLAPVQGLQVYAGNDDDVIDVLNMGEQGGICTLTHVFGPLFRRMADEPAERAQIHASLADAFRDFGIAPLAVTNKAALNLLGIEVGGPRLPYVPLDEAETAVIRGVLERHGLLEAIPA
ncbi:MAG: dihydrodipicolinate synthase family protein, partial [Solirubrobacteraceae bacterium]